MKRLVDHDAATLFFPGAAPIARGVVIGVAKPYHISKGCRNSIGIRQLFGLEEIGLVAILQTNTKLCFAFGGSFADASKLFQRNSKGLFAQNVNISAECLYAHFGVEIVRSANMDGIGLLGIHHLFIIGIDGNVCQLIFFHDPRDLRGIGVTQGAKSLLRRENSLDMIAADGSAADHGNSERVFHINSFLFCSILFGAVGSVGVEDNINAFFYASRSDSLVQFLQIEIVVNGEGYGLA